MREEVGFIGLLSAMALVGWCLRDAPAPAAETQVGSLRTLTIEIDPDELGLPLYPAGRPGRATRNEGAGWSTEQLVIDSPDELPRVLRFYGQKLPDARQYSAGEGVVLSLVRPDGADSVRLDRVDTGTRIMLHRRVEVPADAPDKPAAPD